jgi:ribosome-associated heat shock protein Hsp15
VKDAMRLDKWLWAARFYKSRGLAQAACDGGKVDVNAHAGKPSRAIRPGDRIELTVGEWRRQVVVKMLADQRGPASAARAPYDDLSPPPPPKAFRPPRAVVRSPGLGRPTKRERRLHDRLRDF